MAHNHSTISEPLPPPSPQNTVLNSTNSAESTENSSSQSTRSFHNIIYTNWENFTFWSTIVILIAKCISSVVCLALTKNQPCDQPLKEFMQVFFLIALLQFAALSLDRWMKSNQQSQNSNSTSTVPEGQTQNSSQFSKAILYCERACSFMEALSILWLFFGSAWVLGCKTCSSTAPGLFYTCAAWIIHGYVLICAPLIIFSVIVCIIPAGYLIAQRVRQRRKESFAKKTLLAMPIRNYRQIQLEKNAQEASENPAAGEQEADCCSICLSAFQEIDSIRLLACKHYFHQKCGDKWLVAHAKCPLCLSNIA